MCCDIDVPVFARRKLSSMRLSRLAKTHTCRRIYVGLHVQLTQHLYIRDLRMATIIRARRMSITMRLARNVKRDARSQGWMVPMMRSSSGSNDIGRYYR